MAGKKHEGQGPAGVVVRPAVNAKTQLIRTSGARWSEGAEKRFLAALAATCNVRASAKAAGFSTTAVYKRRRRWPAFAAAWDAARAEGYDTLEGLLVERAIDTLSGGAAVAEFESAAGDVAAEEGVRLAPGMSVGDAINLLRLHRASVRGGAPQRYGANAKPIDIEAVRASVLRKIAAIERADARKAAREAGDQRTA